MSERRPGRPEAARAIWQPHGASTRRRASTPLLTRAIGVTLIAGILFLLGHRTLAAATAALGAAVLGLWILAPTLMGRTERALRMVMGTALAWVLLAPAYFLFVTPYGLLFRRGKGDRLGRRARPEGASYFARRSGPGSLERPY